LPACRRDRLVPRIAKRHYDVDERRVYLTAASCGAIGAWDYLAAHGGEAVAGAVLIAGHPEFAFATAGCALGRVPVWAFHGGADRIVPKIHIVTPIRHLKACTDPAPVDVRLTIYPQADHDSWSQTYDLSAGHDIYAWLLGHERS
jgi:predicted peptidase